MKAAALLHDLGQAIWPDNTLSDLLTSGMHWHHLDDAAGQARGSYGAGLLLLMGPGAEQGAAPVAEGVMVSMEPRHLSHNNATCEDLVGLQGFERMGKVKWCGPVTFAVARVPEALHADDVVLGNGTASALPGGFGLRAPVADRIARPRQEASRSDAPVAKGARR